MSHPIPRCFAMKANFMSIPSRSFRMSRSAFSLVTSRCDLQLLGLHLPVAGKGMLWIGFEAHGDDHAGDTIWVAQTTALR
jgi:hypothetical protein